MSEIPKGFTDNYSNNNKKIDSSGNLNPHPRLAKAKKVAKVNTSKKDTRTPMQKMLDYEASLAPSKPIAPPVSKKPKATKVESAAGKIGEALGAAKEYFVGETYDKAHEDYLKTRE